MRVLFEIFSQTLSTLWAHKLRSVLTMFGIAWGVGSLLLLVGVGEGFRSGNRKQFEEIGEHVMFLFPGRAPAMQDSFTSMRQYYLTYKDYLDIKNEAADVARVAPTITRNDIRSVSEFSTSSGQINGVPPEMNQIRYLPVADGRWLNDMDEAQKRHVVVIGDETRRVLFPGRPAVGSKILLNGVEYFPVNVDVLEPISILLYQPTNRAAHELAKIEVHKIVARNHGFDYRNPDSFDEWDTIRSVDQIGKIFDAMNLFLGSVGLVTLTLGAIGIINIMLVAVADRTREIGLRKAIGATNGSIMFQFFVEGAFLTLLSGGIGMAGAAALMAAISGLPSPPGFDPPKLVPTTAVLAIGALALAGIAAGLYPARRAAMLEPVEALRKE
jgi:putative ABC transport system permease protein